MEALDILMKIELVSMMMLLMVCKMTEHVSTIEFAFGEETVKYVDTEGV